MTQRQQSQTNQSSAREAIDTAKHKAAQATDALKQQATQAIDKAEQQASSMAADRKGRAADNLSGVADAFRQTGERLRKQDRGTIAHYADRAADQLDRIAGYIRNRSMSEVIDDAERLARREPEMFLVGAFALGMLGTRFLKSSRRHTHDTGGSMGGRVRPYAAPGQRHWGGGEPSQEEIRAASAMPNERPGTRSDSYSVGGSPSYGAGPRMYDRREE